MTGALLVIIVLLLVWIAGRVERIERHARRASMSEVDRDMDEINNGRISS
jgi:hypothetical protein